MSTETHEGHHIKCTLLIPGFNENLVVSRNFNRTSTYQISNQVSCSGGVTGGRTDRYSEAKRCIFGTLANALEIIF